MSRRHLLVLSALTSFLTIHAATPQAPVRPAESIGDLLLKDDFQSVERRLQSAPRTAETLAYQGEVEFRKGNFEKARTLYQSALQMDEKTARAHFGMGKLALAKVKSKEALASFKRAIQLSPDKVGPHIGLGLCLSTASHVQDALDEVRIAKRLQPDSSQVQAIARLLEKRLAASN